MPEFTCAWPEGCDLAPHGWGLCKRHWQRARRNGTLDAYRQQMLAAPCKGCGGPIGERGKSRAEYCSKACYMTEYKVSGAKRVTPERQREYARASYWRRRDLELAEITIRPCDECGTPLADARRSSRRFCSQKCSNARSLREDVELRRDHCHRYRTRKRAVVSVGVSERDWRRLVGRYGGRCAYCDGPNGTTVDHVVPIIRGGRHSIGNVLPACKSCNSSKKHLLLIDWRTRILPRRIAA